VLGEDANRDDTCEGRGGLTRKTKTKAREIHRSKSERWRTVLRRCAPQDDCEKANENKGKLPGFVPVDCEREIRGSLRVRLLRRVSRACFGCFTSHNIVR
jgi:hypothetical protein